MFVDYIYFSYIVIERMEFSTPAQLTPDSFTAPNSLKVLEGMLEEAEAFDVDPRPVTNPELFNQLLSTFVTEAFSQVKEVASDIGELLSYNDSLCREKEGLTLQVEQLRLEVKQDFMTGLLNELGFRDKLEEWLEDNKDKNGAKIALIYIDLNNLKKINDKYGHKVGDIAIAYMAKVLAAVSLRRGDIASRPHGDEFILALMDTGEESEHDEKDRRSSDANFDLKDYMNHLGDKVRDLLMFAPLPEEISEEVIAVLRNLQFAIGGCIYEINLEQPSPATIDEILNEADRIMLNDKKHQKNKNTICSVVNNM